MDKDLRVIYLKLLNGGSVLKLETITSGYRIEIKNRKVSWSNEHFLKIYDEVMAECPKCDGRFMAYVARGVSSKLTKGAFGICEECEIRDFLENY